jgi:hypothetical protein
MTKKGSRRKRSWPNRGAIKTFASRDLVKPRKPTVRIAGVSTEILTECYRNANLLGTLLCSKHVSALKLEAACPSEMFMLRRHISRRPQPCACVTYKAIGHSCACQCLISSGSACRQREIDHHPWTSARLSAALMNSFP